MGRFPSGQREQTVNLPSQTSVVRIHPCPPKVLPPPGRQKMREWRNWQTRMIQVHVYVRTCRFKSCFPHQNPDENSSGFSYCSSDIPNICQPYFSKTFGFIRSNGCFFARKNPLMTRLMTRKTAESARRPYHKNLIFSVFAAKISRCE